MGAQKNRLIEMVLLSTHNICFGLEIRKKIVIKRSYAIVYTSSEMTMLKNNWPDLKIIWHKWSFGDPIGLYQDCSNYSDLYSILSVGAWGCIIGKLKKIFKKTASLI